MRVHASQSSAAAAVLVLLMAAPAHAQVPNAAAAINAARGARAATEAAQKKNSEALDPSQRPTSAGQAAPPLQPPAEQAPPPAAGTTASAQPPQTGQAAEPAPTTGYTYDPHGRRDPFVSLLTGGATVPSGGPRPAGLAGLSVNDLSVKGVMKTAKGGFIALLQGSDNKTFIVHAGDKVFDGSVKTITQDAVVFSQDVNDPLSLVKQREVRKTVRPGAR